MILYFTATGNSRWVAEQLAAATNDRALDIASFQNKSEISIPVDAVADRLGVVFPIHSWYIPRPLLDLLLTLHFPAVSYRYAVCTCGDDAGKAMNRLAAHFPVNAAWSVAMPNTYVPMFELDSEEVSVGKVVAARTRIGQIASDVIVGRHVWDVYEGSFPRLKTYLINPLFVHFVVRAKGFHVDAGCISCGKCVKACPLSNITLSSGNPVWGKKCMHCMACLHACPEEIIQYGRSTQKKGRYKLSRFLPR